MLMLRILLWLQMRFPWMSRLLSFWDYPRQVTAYSVYYMYSGQLGLQGISSGCSVMGLGLFFLSFVIIGLFSLVGNFLNIWALSDNVALPTITFWPGLLVFQGWVGLSLLALAIGFLTGGGMALLFRLVSIARAPSWLRNYRSGYWLSVHNGLSRGARYGLFVGLLASWLLTGYNAEAVQFICGSIWMISMLRYWQSEVFMKGDSFIVYLGGFLSAFFAGGIGSRFIFNLLERISG